jgi:hypothetical protein
MGIKGGAREGAGRPKKKSPSAVIPNVKAAALAPFAKARLTERLMDKVMAMDITPLEVMLNTMKLHYDSGTTALKARDLTENPVMKAEMLTEAKKCMNESSAVAEKVAPYLHPKLQAVTLKGDSDNPLNLAGSLRGLSDADLETMQALMIKAATGKK